MSGLGSGLEVCISPRPAGLQLERRPGRAARRTDIEAWRHGRSEERSRERNSVPLSRRMTHSLLQGPTDRCRGSTD